MAKKQDDVYFVGIKDPRDIRRSILESSKDLIQTLQQFERFKQVRKEKDQEMRHLKSLVSEIRTLSGKLKNNLPKTNMRIKLKKEKSAAAKKRKTQSKKAAPKKVIHKPAVETTAFTDFDKLENELDKIEERLSKLA